MKFVQFLPNLITLGNLMCGCIAAVYAINNQLTLAFVFVVGGIVLDFFDGFVARLVNAQSELGKQLDSLADMITSGLLPGLVMSQLLLATNNQTILSAFSDGIPWLFVLGMCITMASAYRLANFNIDERQSHGFIGLPTPANTLWILVLPVIAVYQNTAVIDFIINNVYVLIGLTLLSCYFLNAEIPLMAFKFKSFGIKENVIKYGFILFSLILLIILQLTAIPLIIISYVLLSMLGNKSKK